MIKKSFFGSGKPKLRYSAIDPKASMTVTEIPSPEKISLFIPSPEGPSESVQSQLGDVVKTGQKVRPYENGSDYAVAALTGTVSQISQHTGFLGRPYLALEITAEGDEEEWDKEFTEKGEKATYQTALSFLNQLPGSPNFPSLAGDIQPLDTLVIQGTDRDLLVTTNQWFVVNEANALDQGISLLKQMFNLKRIVLTIPSHLEAGVTSNDAEVRSIGSTYPNGLPKMVMSKILDRTVPAGSTVEEMGVGFVSAEAVVAIAKAFDSGRIPVEKTFTLIDKNENTHLCRAKIGTRIKDVLSYLNIETAQGDRLVLGGPLTGQSVYTDEMPIGCDTDALLVQAAHSVVINSDNQCINCGECVRACPAKMPVNMLVRVLDNGLYTMAAEDYDLLSCVDCGLCSYVCVAKIPVFHYVMLGKNEYARIQSLEVSNV